MTRRATGGAPPPAPDTRRRRTAAPVGQPQPRNAGAYRPKPRRGEAAEAAPPQEWVGEYGDAETQGNRGERPLRQ
eukprot:344947-Lingulodinium_polyedra.AAC.1